MNAVGLLEACRDRELLSLQPWPRQAEIPRSDRLATHAKTAVLVTPGIIDQGTS